MDYQLVVVGGGRSGGQGPVKLGPGVTTVGRQEDCQLRINSSQVSRKHCQFFEQKGQLLVKDLGSSNGTFVNGKKIQGQKVLRPGDELTVGQVRFRVERTKPSSPDGAKAPTSTPGDTAIAAMVGAADEDVFEIDFDEPTAAAPKGAPAAPKASAGADAGASEPIEEASEEPATGTPDDAPGDDAVAEFLLNIELDDEE
ncbi:MAG TPA: FHA domain-containing protein [Isosphaeraceae bacterium]|jgi:pSer/pThr/pTyr-binding forkhead associated (FHA) protein